MLFNRRFNFLPLGRIRKSFSTSINLFKWLEENRSMLKPPVGNHLLYGDGQLKVMIIAGPNERLDYHVNQGEELYYQVEGQMELKIKEKGEFKSIPIQQDQFFILPGGIPHSPQRFPNSIGIVIERERKREELDGLRWYTKEQTLYEEWFHCTDLGSQLVPVIERFKASKAFATQQPQQDTFKVGSRLEMMLKLADIRSIVSCLG